MRLWAYKFAAASARVASKRSTAAAASLAPALFGLECKRMAIRFNPASSSSRAREKSPRKPRKRKRRAPEPAEARGVSPRRRARGTSKPHASFPVAPPRAELPPDYGRVLGAIKERIRRERARVVLSANTAVLTLYWDVGRMILQRQGRAGWGAKIVDRLSSDLQQAFPGMRGFSPRNLKYMRAFAAAWPDASIVQGDLARITWHHNIALLEKLHDAEKRLWYAREATRHGWTQPALVEQIDCGARERQGKAQTNFGVALPSQDGALAEQVFKDPYVFDFLGTADLRREREIEQKLVDHMQKFLLELGSGFAFVGRQVHLEVSDTDLYVDLLFYHLRLHCYVVVELKAVPFDPSFIGKLNAYMSAADDLLRTPEDKPTIGLLLCRSKNRVVVEYALRGVTRPIGVADWETDLVRELPENLKGTLPTVDEIEAELGSQG